MTVKETRRPVNVGVIGAGSIAQLIHLPSLNSITDCRIRAVADIKPDIAASMGKQYKADYHTSDYRKVVADREIDAVFVLTLHDTHHEITRASIDAGKHVFVEKPLALTSGQCEEICEAAGKKGVLVTVGFNRRLSPLSVKAKSLADSMPSPKTIVYRVNAGVLPKDHWTRNPNIGGGRIIGEGCHFLDFSMWLIGGQVETVSAIAPWDENGPVLDELIVSLGFADGSTGVMIYTGQGHPDLPKERIEVFGGGSCFVIDDFISLSAFGIGDGDLTLKRQDKGHHALIENFIEAIRGKTDLAVTAEDGLEVTLVAERALESARGGG